MSRQTFQEDVKKCYSECVTITAKSKSPFPLEYRCSWCDEENGIRVFGGNISHRVCPRHLVGNLVFSRQHHTFEALYYTVIALLAEKEGAL